MHSFRANPTSHKSVNVAEAPARSHWTKVSINTFVRIRLAVTLALNRSMTESHRGRICVRAKQRAERAFASSIPNDYITTRLGGTTWMNVLAAGDQYLSTMDAGGNTTDDALVWSRH